MRNDHRISDARRCLCAIAFLFAGWILLLAGAIPVLWTLSVSRLCLAYLAGWTILSLATHLLWFLSWGEDYHRLVIRCAYIEGAAADDPPGLLFLNLGSLPGFLLGIMLTD